MVPQGAMVPGHFVEVVDRRAEARLIFDRPPVRPAEQQRHPGRAARTEQLLAQLPQLRAERGHFLEDASIRMPGMADDSAVMHFRPTARLAPLEEQRAVGAMCDRLVTLEPHLARALERVVPTPLG